MIFLLTLIAYTIGIVLVTQQDCKGKCDGVWTTGFILAVLAGITLEFMDLFL